jgi:hypothetical protein
MKIKFHMPDFTAHGLINLMFIDYMKRNPTYFIDNVEIASVYGCFPPTKWNGGRIVIGNSTESQILDVIRSFNSRNVKLRYTFTNPNIKEEHLSDRFCNRITELAQNGFNEVIVNSSILEAYIRKNYPMYPIISSTVKQIEDLDGLKAELDKDYKLVVLDYNWNNDFDRLAKVPHKERCEILLNPYCVPHCKLRRGHYNMLGRLQLMDCSGNNTKEIDTVVKELRAFACPSNCINFYQAQKYRSFVKSDDLYSRYVEMGFQNFKIEGRMIHPLNVQESYLYYMVKPEYRDFVRLDIEMQMLDGRVPAFR